MILYSEALQEAERMKKVTGREVEVKAVNCECDYSKLCYLCAGSGTFYELVYAFCDHVVSDGPDLECEENDCEVRERCAADAARVFPVKGSELKSLSENQSELDAVVA